MELTIHNHMLEFRKASRMEVLLECKKMLLPFKLSLHKNIKEENSFYILFGELSKLNTPNTKATKAKTKEIQNTVFDYVYHSNNKVFTTSSLYNAFLFYKA